MKTLEVILLSIGSVEALSDVRVSRRDDADRRLVERWDVEVVFYF